MISMVSKPELLRRAEQLMLLSASSSDPEVAADLLLRAVVLKAQAEAGSPETDSLEIEGEGKKTGHPEA